MSKCPDCGYEHGELTPVLIPSTSLGGWIYQLAHKTIATIEAGSKLPLLFEERVGGHATKQYRISISVKEE